MTFGIASSLGRRKMNLLSGGEWKIALPMRTPAGRGNSPSRSMNGSYQE
jgi:hypothetical protein